MTHPERVILDAANLDEVRAGIDRIDAAIVGLIAQRAQFVAKAASFKRDDADVRAPARVEQVVDRVRALAQDAGLDPAIVEPVYRAMIAAFIDHELQTHARLKQGDA